MLSKIKDWDDNYHQTALIEYELYEEKELEEYLEKIGHNYQTFYQMEEGHVPRPKALSEVLKVIHQWMENVEQENNKV